MVGWTGGQVETCSRMLTYSASPDSRVRVRLVQWRTSPLDAEDRQGLCQVTGVVLGKQRQQLGRQQGRCGPLRGIPVKVEGLDRRQHPGGVLVGVPGPVGGVGVLADDPRDEPGAP